jgi:hypothetical protein
MGNECTGKKLFSPLNPNSWAEGGDLDLCSWADAFCSSSSALLAEARARSLKPEGFFPNAAMRRRPTEGAARPTNSNGLSGLIQLDVAVFAAAATPVK